MNGNLNFGVIPNGQIHSTINYGVSQFQQNVQYVCGTGIPFQNTSQGMGICLPNQQLVAPIAQNYTCINQNGMTFLAFSPNVQTFQQPVPQCFQAVQTTQGLQVFQTITNPVNLSQFCVPSALNPQSFLPQLATYPQQPVVEPSSQAILNEHYNQVQMQEYQGDGECQESQETTEAEYEQETDNPDINEEQNTEEIQEEADEPSTAVPEYQETEFIPTNIASNQDPLTALNSLTSSITSPSTVPSSNLFDVYKSMQNQITTATVPPLGSHLAAQQILGLPDQQFPSNTRAFQVLVPTPQGMAIQTVVTSYPETFSPMIANHAIENSSYCNPELGSVSHLTDQTTSESAPYIAEPCNPNDAALSTTSAVSENTIVSACPENDVEPVPSLCHSTTANINQANEGSEPVESGTSEEKIASSSQASTPSPHCLPDSTEDLCQTTIKQSTSNVVDGIDLEEIRQFARTFKIRRLALGLTQTQVGQALSATEGPAYSQSAICRFEKLDITPRSALKIRPVLESWLREAEEKYQQGNLLQSAEMDYVNISTINKIRKRRTFFSPEALLILNNRFEQTSHPSGREISNIAHEIGYDRDVVRVWFCNKRQSLRHCQPVQRRFNLRSPNNLDGNRRSVSPTQP